MKLQFLNSLLDLIYPPKCKVCNKVLNLNEAYICLECLGNIPLARLSLEDDNKADKLFWGIVEFEKVLSYMLYTKGSNYTYLLHALKYQGEKELGEKLGALMAKALPSSFFEKTDYLIPVPLHESKQKLRGYNQSEWLCKGINRVYPISILPDGLIKTTATDSQTTKDVFSRRNQGVHLFIQNEKYDLTNKRVLLVDDVLTTGATLISCREALNHVQGIQVSAVTFALTHE